MLSDESHLFFHSTGYDVEHQLAEGEPFRVREADIFEREIMGNDMLSMVPKYDAPLERKLLYGVFMATVMQKPVAVPRGKVLTLVSCGPPETDTIWPTPAEEAAILHRFSLIEGTGSLDERELILAGMRAQYLMQQRQAQD
jgi:hypothetical protein